MYHYGTHTSVPIKRAPSTLEDSHRNALRRMKHTAKEKLEPVGHSYDAVMQYKEKVKKLLQDPFLIYRVDCERRVVFKTSKEQLQLAIEMDREGEGHLNFHVLLLTWNLSQLCVINTGRNLCGKLMDAEECLLL